MNMTNLMCIRRMCRRAKFGGPLDIDNDDSDVGYLEIPKQNLVFLSSF